MHYLDVGIQLAGAAGGASAADALSSPWASGSLGAVLVTVLLGIVTGKIVPMVTVEKLLAQRAEQLAGERSRGDEWKGVADAERARNQELARQLDQLMEVGKTTNALVEGLKDAARSERR